MKSGFVSIVGRPNVGKSTLINKLINKKVAITSDKVGTTRNIIYGIYNDDDSQIVFVDTPGISNASNGLLDILNKKAYNSLQNDLVLFVVDIASGFGKGDSKILERLKSENKDVILLLNKVDMIDKELLFQKILELKDLYSFKEIIPISSLKGINIDDLIVTIKKYLPDDVKYFDDNEITNVSERFMVSELIREKVLNLTQDEVPHSVSCLVESMEFKRKSCYINALIVVDRDNLKKIIIGKNGTMLKNIGIMARKDIEDLLGVKVFLKIYVKTIKDWRNKASALKDLGLDELDF